jgi:hypothetical protein
MITNIPEILRHCDKWNSLGVETYVCKVDHIFGIRKLYRDSIRFSPGITENDVEGYNFLGVSLRDSGIMCLDVEGNKGSLDEFMEILDKKSLKIEDFLAESTMNGGIHIYFKAPNRKLNRNVYAIKHGNINFDVLFSGKSFSAPSKYNNLEYRFINKSVFDINSIDEIQEFPRELNFLLKIRDK